MDVCDTRLQEESAGDAETRNLIASNRKQDWLLRTFAAHLYLNLSVARAAQQVGDFGRRKPIGLRIVDQLDDVARSQTSLGSWRPRERRDDDRLIVASRNRHADAKI